METSGNLLIYLISRPKYICLTEIPLDIDNLNESEMEEETQKFKYKLCDRLNYPLLPEIAQMINISEQLPLYMSPHFFESIMRQDNVIKLNPYKNDIFALGLIILECGLLTSIQSIYDLENGQFNYGYLEEIKMRFYQKFDDIILRQIIEGMLDVKEETRISPFKLQETLQKILNNLEYNEENEFNLIENQNEVHQDENQLTREEIDQNTKSENTHNRSENIQIEVIEEDPNSELKNEIVNEEEREMNSINESMKEIYLQKLEQEYDNEEYEKEVFEVKSPKTALKEIKIQNSYTNQNPNANNIAKKMREMEILTIEEETEGLEMGSFQKSEKKNISDNKLFGKVHIDNQSSNPYLQNQEVPFEQNNNEKKDLENAQNRLDEKNSNEELIQSNENEELPTKDDQDNESDQKEDLNEHNNDYFDKQFDHNNNEDYQDEKFDYNNNSDYQDEKFEYNEPELPTEVDITKLESYQADSKVQTSFQVKEPISNLTQESKVQKIEINPEFNNNQNLAMQQDVPFNYNNNNFQSDQPVPQKNELEESIVNVVEIPKEIPKNNGFSDDQPFCENKLNQSEDKRYLNHIEDNFKNAYQNAYINPEFDGTKFMTEEHEQALEKMNRNKKKMHSDIIIDEIKKDKEESSNNDKIHPELHKMEEKEIEDIVHKKNEHPIREFVKMDEPFHHDINVTLNQIHSHISQTKIKDNADLDNTNLNNQNDFTRQTSNIADIPDSPLQVKPQTDDQVENFFDKPENLNSVQVNDMFAQPNNMANMEEPPIEVTYQNLNNDQIEKENFENMKFDKPQCQEEVMIRSKPQEIYVVNENRTMYEQPKLEEMTQPCHDEEFFNIVIEKPVKIQNNVEAVQQPPINTEQKVLNKKQIEIKPVQHQHHKNLELHQENIDNQENRKIEFYDHTTQEIVNRHSEIPNNIDIQIQASPNDYKNHSENDLIVQKISMKKKPNEEYLQINQQPLKNLNSNQPQEKTENQYQSHHSQQNNYYSIPVSPNIKQYSINQENKLILEDKTPKASVSSYQSNKIGDYEVFINPQTKKKRIIISSKRMKDSFKSSKFDKTPTKILTQSQNIPIIVKSEVKNNQNLNSSYNQEKYPRESNYSYSNAKMNRVSNISVNNQSVDQNKNFTRVVSNNLNGLVYGDQKVVKTSHNYPMQKTGNININTINKETIDADSLNRLSFSNRPYTILDNKSQRYEKLTSQIQSNSKYI